MIECYYESELFVNLNRNRSKSLKGGYMARARRTPAPAPRRTPAPAPVPAPTTSRPSSWHRALFYGLAVMLMGLILGALAHWLFQPKPAPVVAKQSAVRKAAPAKKAVVKAKSAIEPSMSEIMKELGKDLEELNQALKEPKVSPVQQPTCCCCIVPQPAPAAVTPVLPTPPSVQPPASSSSCSEADNYYCAPLPAATPQSAPAANVKTPRPVNILSGNTFQLNILSGIGSGNGGAIHGYGGYGSTYGWTPGHEEMVCEPAPHGCYRKWVAHPQPGY